MDQTKIVPAPNYREIWDECTMQGQLVMGAEMATMLDRLRGRGLEDQIEWATRGHLKPLQAHVLAVIIREFFQKDEKVTSGKEWRA